MRDVSIAWVSQRLAGCFNSLQIQPTSFLQQQIFNCTWKEIISQLCTDVGGKVDPSEELLAGHLEGLVGRVEAFQLQQLYFCVLRQGMAM